MDQKITSKIEVFGRYMQDKVPTQEPGRIVCWRRTSGDFRHINERSRAQPGGHATMQLTPSRSPMKSAFGDTWGAINSKITGAITNPAFVSAIDETGISVHRSVPPRSRHRH